MTAFLKLFLNMYKLWAYHFLRSLSQFRCTISRPQQKETSLSLWTLFSVLPLNFLKTVAGYGVSSRRHVTQVKEQLKAISLYNYLQKVNYWWRNGLFNLWLVKKESQWFKIEPFFKHWSLLWMDLNWFHSRTAPADHAQTSWNNVSTNTEGTIEGVRINGLSKEDAIIIWLNPWGSKMRRILRSDRLLAWMPARDFQRLFCKKKFSFWPYNESLIDQDCSVKMAVSWPRSFFGVLLTEKKLR